MNRSVLFQHDNTNNSPSLDSIGTTSTLRQKLHAQPKNDTNTLCPCSRNAEAANAVAAAGGGLRHDDGKWLQVPEAPYIVHRITLMLIRIIRHLFREGPVRIPGDQVGPRESECHE
jgi:hypothetical protein